MSENVASIESVLESVLESCGSNVVRPRAKAPAGNTKKPLGHVVGFGPLSRITTSFGEVFAQTLRVGDRVRTKEGTYLEVRKIDRLTLDEGFLKYHPTAMPVVIRAGALGVGVPSGDLTLAPYQPMHKKQPMTGGTFDRAVDAIGRSQVYRRPESIVTYTVFHCGRPAVILCEGVWFDTAP